MLVYNFMDFKPKMISSLQEESGGSRHFSYLCYLEGKLPRTWEFFLMKNLKLKLHQVLTSASVAISQGESYFALIRSPSRKESLPLVDLFQQALIQKSPLLYQLPSIRKIIIPRFYIIPPMWKRSRSQSHDCRKMSWVQYLMEKIKVYHVYLFLESKNFLVHISELFSTSKNNRRKWELLSSAVCKNQQKKKVIRRWTSIARNSCFTSQ